jgi:HK97 family phage prohead protease
MEHLLLKAATTATDEGTFTAVISTASVDRDKDIIEPAAMVASLAKWAALGKLVPLAWNHTDEVIGHIDPASAIVKNGEVIASGFVDQSIARGEEAWRLVKSGTLSFSFGFLFDPKSGATKLPNGRFRVKELDIFEISTIPVGPANNDTRVLSFKSVQEDALALQARILELDEASRLQLQETMKAVLGLGPEPEKADGADKELVRSVDPLRKQAEDLALELASDGESLRKPPRKVPPKAPELTPLPELKRQMRDEMLARLSEGIPE